MTGKTFIQTGLDGPWVECTDERVAHEDIERLDCAFLMCYSDEWDSIGKRFRLFRSGNHLPSDFPIGTMEENRRLFQEVRAHADIVSFGTYHHGYTFQGTSWLPVIQPLRWRIFQRSATDAINLAADVAYFTPDPHGARVIYECFSICLQMEKDIVIVSKTGSGPYSRGYWTDKTDLEIPENISDFVIDALRESTRAWTGIYPTITWEQHGKQAIFAYMSHPFDWNVTALRSFLGTEAYQKLFPREQRDNFHPLCEYLSIHPTKSLRRAYAKNPYAIIWHVLLRGLGFEDLNIIQKFYAFDKSIAGVPFSAAYFWKGKAAISSRNDARIDWASLEYYLRWVKKNKGQRMMENELYRLAKKGISQEMSDTLSQFTQYEVALPKSLRRMLLKRGLTKEVHDRISEAVLELNPDTRNRILSYPPEDHALEYQIGDYEFRLVKQTRDLTVIGNAMHNCVASYRSDVLRRYSLILTAKKDGNYVICIELDAGHRLYQAYGPHNYRLRGDDLLACRKWVEICNIELARDCLDVVDLAGTESWEISQLPFEKLPSQMSLDELLAIPEGHTTYGYYSYLAAAFENAQPHRIAAPPWKTFSTEREYLEYVFPEGRRIWEAAMEKDDIDAQYALGACYAHGKIMPRDADRALAWLKHPVEEGHIQARTLCQTIKCDDARINGTYDERIREGLRHAKLRIKMQQELRSPEAS